MSAPIAETLRGWHDFFLLMGGAAATLTGLLFVALSLAHGGDKVRGMKHARETFVSPILIHFGFIVVTAAFCVVPDHTPATFTAGAIVLAIAELLNVGWVFNRLVGHHRIGEVDREHWSWHLAFPLAAATLLAVAAWGLWRDLPWSLDALAASVALRLVIGLRNSWRLTLWLVEGE